MGRFNKQLSEREKHLTQQLNLANNKVKAMEISLQKVVAEVGKARDQMFAELLKTISERDEALAKLAGTVGQTNEKEEARV